MFNWILIDIATPVTVIILAGLLIRQILLISFHKNIFDNTDSRKIHKEAIPRLGGVSFLPSVLFAIMLVLGICRQFAPDVVSEISADSITSLIFCACAVMILYFVGIVDDLIGLKYRSKFTAQIIAALLVTVGGGLYMDNMHGFLGIHTLPIIIALPLTVLVIVFITNAINLIDGIDGLSSSLSFIACVIYGCVFYNAGLHIYALLSFATLASMVPFFYYNVFGEVRRHNKIFMGDTGALTVGLTLGFLFLQVCRLPDVGADGVVAGELLYGSGFFSATGIPNHAVIAMAPLIIPCFDVVRVYLRRLRLHHNPFLPDKTHIHHKLLALGLSQRAALCVIIISSVILIVVNLLLSPIVNINLLFVGDITFWGIANILISRAVRRRECLTGLRFYQ